jgi:hypothetical protein
VVRQLYFPESAVVITRFMAEEGVAELVDFMPIAPLKVATDRHRIVRLLRGVRGEIPLCSAARHVSTMREVSMRSRSCLRSRLRHRESNTDAAWRRGTGARV